MTREEGRLQCLQLAVQILAGKAIPWNNAIDTARVFEQYVYNSPVRGDNHVVTPSTETAVDGPNSDKPRTHRKN